MPTEVRRPIDRWWARRCRAFAHSTAPSRVEAKQPAPPRISDTALIVEDNLIIAISAEVILLELGARHVETAASVAQAMQAIERATPSFALLDINLGNESSISIGPNCGR